MLTISKPLSSGQAHSYHQREFSNSRRSTTPKASESR